MSHYEDFRNTCDEVGNKVVNLLKGLEATLLEDENQFMVCIENDIENFRKTGAFTPSFESQRGHTEKSTESTKEQTSLKKRTASTRTLSSSDSSKENEPESNQEKQSKPGRPKRNAFMEATQVINQQVNVSLTTKLRQPSQQQDDPCTLVVKLERLTDNYNDKPSKTTLSENEELQIKKEIMEMPPPSKPPLRQNQKGKRKQSKNINADGIQIKPEPLFENNRRLRGASRVLNSNKQSSHSTRDSDVEIQAEPIDTIVLNDTINEVEKSKTKSRTKNKRKHENKQNSTDDESEAENKKKRFEEESVPEQVTRVTRTKTRAAAKNKEIEKQLQSDSSTEDEKVKITKSSSKRTKTKRAVENNNTSEYEDAVSDVEKTANVNTTIIKSKVPMNETIVVNKPIMLNETVVIEKPKNVMNETITISTATNKNKQVIEDTLMTDDEDVVKNSPVVKKSKKVKAVFSPYEERPVKKRVQAFEKLCAEANPEIPSKIPCISATKITAKLPEKTASEGNDDASEDMKLWSNNLKKPSNSYITPLKSKLPRNPSTSMANSTLLSDLKASQSESRARQLRQKQKENEVLRKQEAIMQALTEERKKKREERQLKAQQSRDAMEREKQKMLDSAVKAKEEKLKKVLSEREEKLQKQREQAALKRAQAIKKAAEEKLREEKKKEETRIYDKHHDDKIIPPYLKHKTPLLPTIDCYDSDDDEKDVKSSQYVRSWEKKQTLLTVLQQMRFVQTHKKSFFYNSTATPNLVEIFPSIESYKLKRTSSAIWERSAISKLDTLSEED